jgi:hypothetical protein
MTNAAEVLEKIRQLATDDWNVDDTICQENMVKIVNLLWTQGFISVAPSTVVYHVMANLREDLRPFQTVLLELEKSVDGEVADEAASVTNKVSLFLQSLELTLRDAARFMNRQNVERVEVRQS